MIETREPSQADFFAPADAALEPSHGELAQNLEPEVQPGCQWHHII